MNDNLVIKQLKPLLKKLKKISDDNGGLYIALFATTGSDHSSASFGDTSTSIQYWKDENKFTKNVVEDI